MKILKREMFWCKTFPLVLKFPVAAVAEWQSLCRLGNIYCKCLLSLCAHLTLHHPRELQKFCHPHRGGRKWSREDLGYLFPGILEILEGGSWVQTLCLRLAPWAGVTSWGQITLFWWYSVLSTVDGFYSRIVIFVSCFSCFSHSLLGKTHPETGW